jgi:dolichyl-phosphate-mannose-protein mannosyltransferase
VTRGVLVRRSFSVGGWALIFVLALGIRVYGLRYGLPAVYNPDEVAIMSRALAFAKWDFNPHNFLYPSFYFYALFAWEGLTALAAVATRAVGSFGAFQREFFLDPTRVFVAGRLLTALLGTATVVATGLLGVRIASRRAGVLAALLLAVAPLHVLNSHYVKHDVPVTLLIVLAYLAYERLWSLPPEGGSYRSTKGEGSLIAAAAITGVAFSTHYYAIFLAIPLAWSAARGASRARDAVRRIAIAALVSAAVFFLLSPFILVEPATALRDIRANRQIVVDRAVDNLGYVATAASYGRLLLFDTVGLPAALLAIAGLFVSARRDPQRTLWLLAFPVPFLLFIAGTVPASRYLVPIVPFATLFAAIALIELWRPRLLHVGLLLFLVAFGTAGLESYRTVRFMRQTDTRTLALDYIRAHIPSETTILTQPYSVPIEPTAEVLREAVRRSGREMPTKTSLQIARVPYPSPAYRIIYLGRGLDADKLYLPYDQLDGRDPLAALRAEHVAFVVLKRYNRSDPTTLPFLAALAREGRRIAVFSPYRETAGAVVPAMDEGRPEPFLHNTDARIVPALERPGPTVEIWQIQ